MGWLGKLFGTDKPVDNLVDKDNGLLAQAGSGVGGLKLTDEEVMEQNAKTVSSVQAFIKDTLSENTERSKTRRSIAVLWIKTQLAIVLMCCIAAPWKMSLAEFYFKLATSGLMLTVTTAICIFFFGSHGLARMQETKRT